MKGDDISTEAKILIICEQYDALRSKRPYKPPFTHEETCKIILEGDGRTKPEHFDPQVLKAFELCAAVFEKLYDEYQD